jgi:hypothetical protein
MSESPVPLKEGELIPEQAKSLRLSDAEEIAAERLDSGGEGRPSNASPALPEEPASPSLRLTDRIDDLRSDANEPSLSGTPVGVAAEISDKTGDASASDLGALEHQDHVVQPGGTASNPNVGVASHPPHDLAPASAILPGDEAHVPGNALMPGLPALPPLPLRVNNTTPQAPMSDASPVGEALSLSVKAKAAADSLESLKRLLENQLPVPSKPKGRPPVPRELAPRAAPPPFPLLRSEPVPEPRSTEQQPVLPPPTTPLPKLRGRLDVRGFLAGFALSGAIGVVLYLFMTAG